MALKGEIPGFLTFLGDTMNTDYADIGMFLIGLAPAASFLAGVFLFLV